MIDLRSWVPARWPAAVRTVVLLSLIVCVPLIVALVALGRASWHPVLDLAMTELRVRDVGTRHTPLIGLPGRIGTFPDQGSHPGPLSFYLLAPAYRILGSTPFSLELGTVLIHGAAITAALVLAHRRGGTRLCIALAALLAVLVRGYGANVLTQPWNPYLPVLAWIVVLLAAWSLLEGDSVAAVFYVAAGSLCAQTHVPYLALVGGLGVALVVWLVVRQRPGAVRDRVRLPAVPMPGIRRWSIVAVITGVVLWLPPVADQIRRTPGNFSMLSDYFRNPPEAGIGPRAGLQLMLEHLNVLRVIGAAFTHSDYFKTTAFDIAGSSLPGALFLLVWIACAVQAWRLRHRALVHLHAVIAVVLVLGVVAMSSIFGFVWYYLTFWAWGILGLMTFTIVWTIAITVRDARPAMAGQVEHVTRFASIGVLAASVLAFSYSAAHVDPPENQLSRQLGDLVEQTVVALDADTGAATGHAGTYLVTWSDVAQFGSEGYGLVNELERRGFTAGVTDTFRVPVTLQRVIVPGSETAVVHFASGASIDEWRADPMAVEVAYSDLRSESQQAEFQSLRTEVQGRLRGLGLDDLVDVLDRNLFGVQLDPRVPRSIGALIDEMLQIGLPAAVFVTPPTAVGS